MNLSPYIYYPSLDLFLYHLRDGLGESQEKIRENHSQFWANLPPEIQVDFETEARAANSDTIKLLELTQGKKTYPLAKRVAMGHQIGGYYYPLLLSDTYGLLVDCCIEEQQHSTILVRCFQSLKEIINNKHGDLGKTWMISGYRDSSFSPEDIAKSAYHSFTGKDWQYVRTGKFLGADVFEVWQSPQSHYWESIENGDGGDEEKSTVFIVIYPNQDTMAKAAQFYDSWLHLLCHRHKIFWAYRESRRISERLHNQLSLVNETIQQINKSQLDLYMLKKNIAFLSNYVIQLEQLEILNQAIEVNRQNYKAWLNHIINKASQEGDTNLKFLEEFNVITNQYQKQIQQDYATFQASLGILSSLRDTIRGIMEIEQAQSDRRIETQTRNFQNGVSVVGVGVGVASVTASAVSPFVEAITKQRSEKIENGKDIFIPSNALLNFSVSLIISLMLGLLASLIVATALGMLRSHDPPS
ncbi:hypothetical protein ACE1CD_05540 [Aerosakkonema sp. BLCC-F183]|uniref:hypothetical protein n=1 Tax=Aerosakkonema sp. BLCC-F183 TaxID=3342834 RepID=UPI0035BA6856